MGETDEKTESGVPFAPEASFVRGLGLALIATGRVEAGIAYLVEACHLEPANRWLLIETMGQAIAGGAPEDALLLVNRAPVTVTVTALGRVQFLNALASAQSGKPEKAAAILHAGIEVDDLRVGENSIPALWKEACPTEDVPAAYQVSMNS